MILKKGEKVHVIHRRYFEKEARRHFVGTVEEYETGVARVVGYVYTVDRTKYSFMRRPEKRTRIISLVSGNVLVIAAYTGWLSDGFSVEYSASISGGADTIATAPLVEIIVLTDQGITRLDLTVFMGPTQGHPEVMYDTGLASPQE
jgi:hypothetical protein